MLLGIKLYALLRLPPTFGQPMFAVQLPKAAVSFASSQLAT